MTSKIKVDNINKVSDDSNIIKKCGTTTTIGSGASNPIVVDGSAITLGRCGGTVALASGATQTGFGRTGTVDWQTGSIKTSTFTAANGEGYFCNTTGGAFTANLPAGSAGAIVSFKDYANTWQTNNLTLTANGTDKINGVNGDATLNIEDQSVTLVYVDSTKGWRAVQDSTSSIDGAQFIAATGGTVLTNGDFKTHIFTGPGTFCVSAGSGPIAVVDYLVIAGGGAGGKTSYGGGGGAGGFRISNSAGCVPAPTMSPLVAPTNLPVGVSGYPITVGGGGSAPNPNTSNAGSNSIFSTITSAGGGTGEVAPANGGPLPAAQGGSGGGGHADNASNNGSGNTPPVSPPQGNNGGFGQPGSYGAAGGGGGALAAGSTGTQGNPATGGAGGVGAGVPNAFGTSGQSSGGYYYFSGGGGGGPNTNACASQAAGGLGGGGISGGSNASNGTAGTVNTGGGSGGNEYCNGTVPHSQAGGSGIVIIRYKFQN